MVVLDDPQLGLRLINLFDDMSDLGSSRLADMQVMDGLVEKWHRRDAFQLQAKAPQQPVANIAHTFHPH